MGHYEIGIETSNRIIAACRKLFYQQGYDRTTFKDICREAKINQSAIHYHFKSKDTLLKIIYNESIQKNNLEIEKYCEADTLPFTKYIFGGELYLYKVLHDPRFLQFNLDAGRLMNADNLNDYIQLLANTLFYHDKSTNTLSEDDFYDLMASLGYDRTMLLYVSKNVEHLDFHQLSEHNMEIYRRIMHIGDDDYAAAKEQLALLEAKCNWNALDTTLDI